MFPFIPGSAIASRPALPAAFLGNVDVHFGETDRSAWLLVPHPHHTDRDLGASYRSPSEQAIACSLCSHAPLPGAVAEPGGLPVGVRLSGGAAGHPAFGVEREKRGSPSEPIGAGWLSLRRSAPDRDRERRVAGG
jgi:hypothetical protein